MKIHIQEKERKIHLTIPTGLIFNRVCFRVAFRMARKQGGMSSLTPEAADILAAEFRRIKKRYGSWTLVEVQSADGELVEITL